VDIDGDLLPPPAPSSISSYVPFVPSQSSHPEKTTSFGPPSKPFQAELSNGPEYGKNAGSGAIDGNFNDTLEIRLLPTYQSMGESYEDDPRLSPILNSNNNNNNNNNNQRLSPMIVEMETHDGRVSSKRRREARRLRRQGEKMQNDSDFRIDSISIKEFDYGIDERFCKTGIVFSKNCQKNVGSYFHYDINVSPYFNHSNLTLAFRIDPTMKTTFCGSIVKRQCGDTEYPKSKFHSNIFEAGRSSANETQEWSLQAGWFLEGDYVFRINKKEDSNPCQYKHPESDPHDNLTVPGDVSSHIHRLARENRFVQYMFTFRRACLEE